MVVIPTWQKYRRGLVLRGGGFAWVGGGTGAQDISKTHCFCPHYHFIMITFYKEIVKEHQFCKDSLKRTYFKVM